MRELLEIIRDFKFIEVDNNVMTDETKNEVIEFLRFLIVFAGGYSKFMTETNNAFNPILNLWLIRLRNEGFSQAKLNTLSLRFGYSLKTEER